MLKRALAAALWGGCVFVSSTAFADAQTVLFGTAHAVALRNNGDVLTWGENTFCQLGRPSSTNYVATPALAMRNVTEIAVAVSHTFALTTDGKLYAWGGNGGLLGVGHEYELCEGPEVVTSLADKTIAHVATGYNFAVAVTTAGDLYCAGDNDMLQCPAAKNGKTTVFLPVPFPELAGKVAAVSAGMFHTLVQTKDGKMYAFGRGRDGQLGPGPTANGFRAIPELNDVVQFSAGTWHSAAVKSDGSVWLWGNNSKSQLCDGTTTNRSVPTRVMLPGSAKAVQAATGGLSTVIRTSDGALYACGDNQAGLLGVDTQTIVSRPTAIPLPVSASTRLSMGGGNAAVSIDGCAVRLSGRNEGAMVNETDTPNATDRVFSLRSNLTLCAPRPATPQSTLVREYPKGGQSGCWTPRVEEDAARNPKFAGQVQAMVAAEAILRNNAVFTAPPLPSRFRTTLDAGPYNESGARLHIKIVPERKTDLTRLWTGTCDVIPQVDRIGGAIYQISLFFNNPFGSATGAPPKLTGRVAGYPEYDHWVYITKDGRLPWIPQTLAERLDLVGEKRARALADWIRDRASEKAPDLAAIQPTYELMKKTDPAGAEKMLATMREIGEDLTRRRQFVYPAIKAELEKQIADFKTYRASFPVEQLAAAAVPGDPSGQLKRESDAKAAALRALTADEQRRIDEWAVEARALERQAQVEMRDRHTDEASRLRSRSNDLAQQARALRDAHLERISPAIDDLNAHYELVSLKPGPADLAIRVKANPGLPVVAEPNRIQVIAVYFGEDPVPSARSAWQRNIKATFDFAALAALIK